MRFSRTAALAAALLATQAGFSSIEATAHEAPSHAEVATDQGAAVRVLNNHRTTVRVFVFDSEDRRVELGEPIEAQQPIGRIHTVDDLEQPPQTVIAPQTGFLLCKRPPGQVTRGDNIAIIARDLDPQKYGLT